MEETQQTYWELLARYFSGNASEEDKVLVQRKKEEDPSFAHLYQQAKDLFVKPASDTPAYEPNVDKGWERLQLKAQMREAPLRDQQVGKTSGNSTPVVRSIRKSNFVWAIAASIAFLLAIGYGVLSQLPQQQDWIEVQTALNETQVLNLSDGSQVTLNENSHFSYPVSFAKDTRTVRLTGEAFFEVEKAEGKRFTVLAEGTKTEVIGTAFYLQAYPNQEVRIQVKEGKVAFASQDNGEAVFLTPGEEARMPGSRQTPAKQAIEDPNFQSWQNKKLQFSDTRLDQLVKTLEAYYETPIAIGNKELSNCRFTVSFEDSKLEDVLEILSLTANLSIEQESGTYIISGESCK